MNCLDRPPWWRAIWFGEEGSTDSGLVWSLAAREQGMMSLIAVVTFLFFLILISFVGNVGATVNRKIEAQALADAVARSAALQMARGLNAVTACNHLVGELNSFIVLHEAIGGKRPGRDQQDTVLEDTLLRIARLAQDILGPIAGHDANKQHNAYDEIIKKVKSENTILQGSINLKKRLTDLYKIENTGLVLIILRVVPVVGPALYGIGVALYESAKLLEPYFLVEAKALAAMETFAENTVSIRDGLVQGIGLINGLSRVIRSTTAGRVEATARAMGQLGGGEGAVFYTRPQLPLSPDPIAADAADASFAKAQLVRATYPWVFYHRRPIIEATRWMVFSETPANFRNWCDTITLTRSREFYERDEGRLLMLNESAPDRKGKESWTRDAEEAAEFFTVVGFAHLPASPRWSGALFRRSRQDGVCTFSQGMVYNANGQYGASSGDYQPDIGFDTLNWAQPTRNHAVLEHPSRGKWDSAYPQIKLNWQVKLVPVSRLGKALNNLPAPFQEFAPRLDPRSPLSRMH